MNFLTARKRLRAGFEPSSLLAIFVKEVFRLMRKLEGAVAKAFYVYVLALGLFHLYTAVFDPLKHIYSEQFT